VTHVQKPKAYCCRLRGFSSLRHRSRHPCAQRNRRSKVVTAGVAARKSRCVPNAKFVSTNGGMSVGGAISAANRALMDATSKHEN
jgi:hypothetical protein